MSGELLSSAVSSNVRPQDAVRVEKTQPVDDTEKRQELAAVDGESVPVSDIEVEASDKDIKQAVSHINEFIQSVRRELEFRVDDESGRVTVTVINTETEEVIRVIPRTDVVRIADQLEEHGPAILSAEV